MIDKINGLRDEKLLKQCFDAIRYSNVAYKYEETK